MDLGGQSIAALHADPVNLVSTVESILKQTGKSDETKQLIRQQVGSLATAHTPRANITKAEQSALKTLRADSSTVILTADKGPSTVVMDKADYIQKANALLEDRQAYLPCNDERMRRPVTQQVAFLSYDAKFSTRNTRPEDFIASFESTLQKYEAGEWCKNAVRQQMSTLLLKHKRQMTISKAEDRELLKIRKIKDSITLLADKGRSTAVIDKAEYCIKLRNLLMDNEDYAPSTVSEF
nr:unnamed protein product [Spirometra erinaceieuropaei]